MKSNPQATTQHIANNKQAETGAQPVRENRPPLALMMAGQKEKTMNFVAIECGKYLLRNHYTAEQHAEMLREFRCMNLPEEEFPAYVYYLHEAETAHADPHCW